MKEEDYSYNRFNSKGVRVGQAAFDMMMQEQPEMTAEELLEQMEKGIVNYIQEAAEKGCAGFDGGFFIIHLFKKTLTQHDIENAMGQKAVCFQYGPTEPSWYMSEKPNDTKSLYRIDPKSGLVKLLWTVPGWEDCKTIKKNPSLYDRDLVQWVKEAVEPLQSAAV